MWLGRAVFLVGGQTNSDGVGSDSELFESNTEFYVLNPSGAFEPFRDLMEWNHSLSLTMLNFTFDGQVPEGHYTYFDRRQCTISISRS